MPIAITNINELPRNIEPQQLVDLLDNHDRIRELRGLAQKFLEWINDTWIANGMDAVSLTDTFVSSLNRARKNNDAIDLPMTELDNYNKRHAKQIVKEDKDQDTTKITRQ